MTQRLQLRLRDHTPVILRPLQEEDRPIIAEAYRRVSPEARYQRFWTRTGEVIGDRMIDRLVENNPDEHMTWAVLDPTRSFPGLGGASWWRHMELRHEAELSAIVLDQDQHRGIGTLLLATVWLTALRAGVDELVGHTLMENRSAAKWMRDCGGIGSWDGYKLTYRWNLHDLDHLPETFAAADLASWLALLGDDLL